MGSEQSNADRAECASESNEQIERRQVTRGRFSLNEFAVAKKTDNKECGAEEGHADLNRVCDGRIINRIAGGAQCNGQQSCDQPARIKLVFSKNHGKGKQIERAG